MRIAGLDDSRCRQCRSGPGAYQPPSGPCLLPTATAPETPCSPSLEELALIDQRLAASTLTVAQVEVARYDQSVTWISLTEAFALRGWL